MHFCSLSEYGSWLEGAWLTEGLGVAGKAAEGLVEAGG